MDIKTVDVKIKEWFDKKNGNSYFAGKIIVNYGLKNEQYIKISFQYGYDNQFEYIAFEELKRHGYIPYNITACYWRYYRDNNIIYRYSIQPNCKKKELMI